MANNVKARKLPGPMLIAVVAIVLAATLTLIAKSTAEAPADRELTRAIQEQTRVLQRIAEAVEILAGKRQR